MLFILNDSVCHTLCQTAPPSHDMIEGIENIARARRQGKHHVLARRDALEHLSNCQHLSIQAQAVYRHVLNRYPTLGTLERRLNRRVEVMGDDGIFRIREDHGSKTIQVSASFFADFTRVTEVVLLCENQTDTRFFRLLAEVFLVWSDLGNLTVNCESRGGGGSTTAVEYENICTENKRFCLCITDSDRTCPGKNIGDTARALVTVDENYYNIPKELIVLNERDVENLVPKNLLEEAIHGDPSRTPGVIFLELLLASNTPEAYIYWDMKNGLKLGDILKAAEASPFRQYWLKIAGLIRTNLPMINADCLDDLICVDSAQCGCLIAGGIGQRTLEDVIEYIKTSGRKRAVHLVPEPFKSRWTELGLLLVSWLCTSEPLRSL